MKGTHGWTQERAIQEFQEFGRFFEGLRFLRLRPRRFAVWSHDLRDGGPR